MRWRLIMKDMIKIFDIDGHDFGGKYGVSKKVRYILFPGKNI